MIALFVIVLLITLAIVFEYATYKECRKVHPVWYCLGDK